MAELTVAVVGCGDVGRAHAFTWTQLSGSHLVSVCDANGHAAAKAAADYGVEAYTTLQDALDAEQVDIVDVCVDDPTETVRFALRAGANVLCPAVPARSVEEIQALADVASDRERVLMPAFLFRFHPLVLHIKERVDEDDLGALAMFRCRISGGIAQPGLLDAISGPLCHAVDLFRYLCGEISQMSGTASFDASNEERTVSSAAAVLRGDRVVAVVEGSTDLIAARSAVELYGTAGGCVVDFETGVAQTRTADSPVWQTWEEAGAGALERLLAHFADVLRGLQSPLCTVDDAVRAVAVCSRIAPA